ncbi:MAG: hypothetical protein GY845_22060 [Planctomycetes bacterium]|nr:hypothetical protein [Planctomycetota bacterium]
MKQTMNTIMKLVVFLGMGSIQTFAAPFAVGPYLGQTPPGPVAQVFAPGLICDTRPFQWESWPSFSADGNTFCFNRLRYAYITVNTDQGWTTPKRIESIPYHAWSGVLSPDANSIYIRCGPFSKVKQRRRRGLKMCMRRCTRTDQGWSLPLELGPPFDDAMGDFTVAADNSICFDSRKDDFSIAPFVGNTRSQSIKLPIEMGNLRGHSPGIAPDKSFLVFYSIKPGAPGGTDTDLYLTLRRPDGSWTKPQRMGPRINTPYLEFGARISSDKKYMFFTRSTGWNLRALCDTSDIYWVELKEHLPESHR